MYKLLFTLALFLAPISAYAVSYTYTCTDLTSGDSPSCTDGVWTKASSFSLADSSGDRPFASGTWYFNGVVEGSGTPFRLTCYEYNSSPCTTYEELTADTYVDFPFDVTGGTSDGIYLWGQSSSDVSIGPICVSDTQGECASGGSSSGTTTSYIVNTNQDIFNGIVLFFMMFTFIVWYFRGKTI